MKMTTLTPQKLSVGFVVALDVAPNITHMKVIQGTHYRYNVPQNLISLSTDDDFNQSVSNLPHLKILITGTQFNQPVDNLPPTHSPHNWILFQPTS
jgi:hypothetical protein